MLPFLCVVCVLCVCCVSNSLSLSYSQMKRKWMKRVKKVDKEVNSNKWSGVAIQPDRGLLRSERNRASVSAHLVELTFHGDIFNGTMVHDPTRRLTALNEINVFLEGRRCRGPIQRFFQNWQYAQDILDLFLKFLAVGKVVDQVAIDCTLPLCRVLRDMAGPNLHRHRRPVYAARSFDEQVRFDEARSLAEMDLVVLDRPAVQL